MTDEETIELILLENKGQIVPKLERFDSADVRRVLASLIREEYLRPTPPRTREGGQKKIDYELNSIGQKRLEELRDQAA